ncbi:hypothetical protein JCM33374_g3468 [Metschnikowia sp. JCM 33374]|nr:hypothetical protein JCM33374_g3468 [Metschnikowia sp. JCM 33374]
MSEANTKFASGKLKTKRVRRNPKQKNVSSLIEYGDPDTKVVVRLLPPTLEQTDFLEQTEKSSPTFRLGYKSLAYKKGTKATQLFEEPNFSLAFLKFKSRESADLFKEEISYVSFKETETGDNIKCNTLKPIFGELSADPVIISDDSVIDNETFKLFSELRENNEGHVDINDVVAKIKANAKQRKLKTKQEKRKQEKSKSQDSKKSNSGVTEAHSKTQSKKKNQKSPEGPTERPKDLRSKRNESRPSSENIQGNKQKSAKKRKPKKQNEGMTKKNEVMAKKNEVMAKKNDFGIKRNEGGAKRNETGPESVKKTDNKPSVSALHNANNPKRKPKNNKETASETNSPPHTNKKSSRSSRPGLKGIALQVLQGNPASDT